MALSTPIVAAGCTGLHVFFMGDGLPSFGIGTPDELDALKAEGIAPAGAVSRALTEAEILAIVDSAEFLGAEL